MKSIFDKKVSKEVIERINNLNLKTKHLWGKMSVDQVFAHLNVMFDYVYTNKYPAPSVVDKFFIKLFAKQMVVGDKPYSKSGQTAPEMIITDKRDFEKEKAQLIEYIQKTQQLGESYFDGKESHAFGRLTIKEWNTLFYKHLDHHLKQFGA